MSKNDVWLNQQIWNTKSINCQTKAERILRGYIRTPKTVAIRISRIRKPIFHVRTDTEKSRS